MICEEKDMEVILDNLDNFHQPVAFGSRFIHNQLMHYTPPGIQDDIQPILLVAAGSDEVMQKAVNQFHLVNKAQ